MFHHQMESYAFWTNWEIKTDYEGFTTKEKKVA